MNFKPYTIAHTVEGGMQTIAQGSRRSTGVHQEPWTNGGGFFNANGAHPF